MHQPSETKRASSWTASEKTKLTQILSIVCEGQKAYGKEINIKSVFLYFQLKFEHRHSVEELIYAIGKYTDRKNDIPAPADIFEILNPTPPRITEAEFVEAQKWQERNGFPAFSSAKMLIEDYRAQQEEQRESFRLENKTLQQLAASSVKRISA